MLSDLEDISDEEYVNVIVQVRRPRVFRHTLRIKRSNISYFCIQFYYRQQQNGTTYARSTL